MYTDKPAYGLASTVDFEISKVVVLFFDHIA